MDEQRRSSAGVRYQVGDLTVDPALARVTRQGVEVPLPKLSFDLLRVLVEAAPALVTPDQLLDQVWTGLVVNPETVSQRVKLLRGALGDDPRTPRYIHVTRGRGYRLICPVHKLEDPPRPSAAATSPESAPAGPAGMPPAVRRSSRWQIAVLSISLVALLTAALAWRWRNNTSSDSTAAVSAVLTPRAVAVMPFRSLGEAADDRVLSLGIAESVLHQLSTLGDLTVIARSSSFALEKQDLGARDIGSRLGAQFILEGSVQRSASQLRVTTQLIDAATGASLWSLQFNRGIEDVFAMQDEIALKVAQALKLSLDVTATERASGQGTMNFDAYFEYLQARSVLAEVRTADLPLALKHLQRALQLDPSFARAHVELARALVRQAEFHVGPDRGQRFETALKTAQQLVDRALQLDPDEGRAYLQRAYQMGFTDLLQAEKDYRHGLALAPNDASGYEGLAAVLFADPRRHEESLAALERARRLDPLEPAYDVTKAVFLFYGQGNVAESTRILRDVVERDPQYVPGLFRLGEVSLMSGEIAAGIRFLETGLKLDPSAELPLRELTVAYLDLDDERAARSVFESVQPVVPGRQVFLKVFRRNWVDAGDEAYVALQSETYMPYDEDVHAMALRRHARVTGEVREAQATLEQLAALDWTHDGQPVLPDAIDMRTAAVGVADMLLLAGDKVRAARLLQAILVDTDRDAKERKRDGRWTRIARAESLALLGRPEEAVREIERGVEGGNLPSKHWLHLYSNPSFDSLRGREDFQRVLARVKTKIGSERQKLDEMRRNGLIPAR